MSTQQANPQLNDPLTHLAKSRSALRSAANEKLDLIAAKIPKSMFGVKVEYDVGYESEGFTIKGYKYTDLFTCCVWIAPCNTRLAIHRLALFAAKPPTEEGKRIVQQVIDGMEDKYLLRTMESTHEYPQLVVMPGSNMLSRNIIDYQRLEQLVNNGAHIKLHPITNPRDAFTLIKRFGDRVLPHTAKLYPLIRAAKTIHCCGSSEAGLAGILLGKTVSRLERREYTEVTTFYPLYRGMEEALAHRSSMYDRLVSLFSYPESGLITPYHEDFEMCMTRYFGQFCLMRHGG